MKLLSQAKTGRWSAGLMLLFLVLMFLKFSELAEYWLPLPTPVIAVLPVVGFFLGIVSVVKHRDRSILTLVSILLGLLVIAWIAAELAYPH